MPNGTARTLPGANLPSMTVPSETSRSNYVGNGVTTAFSTGWYFLSETEVKVTLTLSGGSPVIQTLGVHYTVAVPTPGSGSSGTVTMLVAPAVASALRIERDVPLTQVTSFRTQGSFTPAIHEDAMDEIVFQTQELDRRVGDLESAGAPGSVVAGNGLSFTSTTLNVGAGAGVVVLADTVDLDFGTDPGDIGVVASEVTPASAGSMNLVAQHDHSHVAFTAIAGTIAVADTASQGAAGSLSRSDHRHALPAPAAPANVTKAAASAGASTTVARADHKHDVTTATAVDVSDSASSEGVSTSLARADHIHFHGARAGGTTHPAATTGVNGFMSAADKVLLDALTIARSVVHADNNVAQSIPHNVATTVLFALEKIDTKNEYDPLTGIFTAQVAGYYRAAAATHLNTTAADAGTCFLNIVGPSYSVSHQGQAQILDNSIRCIATGIFQLTVGQTLKVQLLQTNTPAAARSLTSTQTLNWFNVERLLG